MGNQIRSFGSRQGTRVGNQRWCCDLQRGTRYCAVAHSGIQTQYRGTSWGTRPGAVSPVRNLFLRCCTLLKALLKANSTMKNIISGVPSTDVYCTEMTIRMLGGYPRQGQHPLSEGLPSLCLSEGLARLCKVHVLILFPLRYMVSCMGTKQHELLGVVVGGLHLNALHAAGEGHTVLYIPWPVRKFKAILQVYRFTFGNQKTNRYYKISCYSP